MVIQRSRNRKGVRGERLGQGSTLHRHQVGDSLLPVAGWISGTKGGLGLVQFVWLSFGGVWGPQGSWPLGGVRVVEVRLALF